MKAVRAIIVPDERQPGGNKKLYLTFDDGPSMQTTGSVLKILSDEHVSATFFVIAEKALRNEILLHEIVAQDHTIGNHSLDHGYSAFFGPKKKIATWVEQSELLFANLGVAPVGFRPPAGVVTPPLLRALEDRKMPLILWNVRFYDSVIPWTKARALRSLPHTANGSIVLLHDAQPQSRIESFCETLRAYIRSAKSQGFEFAQLTEELCLKQATSNSFKP